jgi:hypothetical protein
MMGRGGEKAGEPDKIPGPIGFVTYSGFALVLLANSSDSVSIMTPLLADLKPMLVLICFAAAMTAAIMMGLLANYLVRHPAMILGRKVREMGSALPSHRDRPA